VTGVAAAAVTSVGADPDRDDRTLAAVLLVLMHAITRQPVADLDVGPVAAKLVRLRLATAYASSGASVATIVTAVPYAATSVMMSPIALQSKRMARAPIFCTLQGGRIDSSYVRRLLPRLARKAGIDRRVHAHGLRHTYAAELAREGTAINVIRDALGHTSLAVTDRYLRDVAPTHVIDTMRARRWET